MSRPPKKLQESAARSRARPKVSLRKFVRDLVLKEDSADRTIQRVDDLLTALAAWRETLVRIGQPRARTVEAHERLRLFGLAMKDDPDFATPRAARMKEWQALSEEASALGNMLIDRESLDKTVRRLHAALAPPPPTFPDLREAIVNHLRQSAWRLQMDLEMETILEAVREHGVRSRHDAPRSNEEIIAAAAIEVIEDMTALWPALAVKASPARRQLEAALMELATSKPGRPRKGTSRGSRTAVDIFLAKLGMKASANTIKSAKRRARLKNRVH